jgi:hypothetical protein
MVKPKNMLCLKVLRVLRAFPMPPKQRLVITIVLRVWLHTAIVTSLSTWYKISGSELSKWVFIVGTITSMGAVIIISLRLHSTVIKMLKSNRINASNKPSR